MTVTLAVSYTSGNIDLLAGSDRLILGNFANTVTITNIETFVGGTTSDTVTLASSYTSGRIDLGAGNDSISGFTSGADKIDIRGFFSFADITDVQAAATYGANTTINLGSGNTVTLIGVSTITSGMASDLRYPDADRQGDRKNLVVF